MKSFWKILAVLFLLLPATAQQDAATANQAKLSPDVMRELAKLKSVGITEVLVPTWFPDDLGMAVGKVDTSDTRFGPSLEITWPSSNRKAHSLVLRGTGGGLGGPGPDSTVKVDNPVLGPIDLWICVDAPMAFRYGTSYALTVPRGEDREYYLDVQTVGNSDSGLSKLEMQKILASVRKLKI